MNNSLSFNVQPTQIQFNMQLSLSFFTLAAVASFCGATALPPVPSQYHRNPTSVGTLSKRSVHCETSGGSPTTGDAVAAARYIQSLDPSADPGHNLCCQNNAGGSFCTMMWCEGTACVGICSNGAFSFPGCDYCLNAGNGLLDVANSCSSGGRSGGWADAPYELRLIVLHS
jgi:hypothetical protein